MKKLFFTFLLLTQYLIGFSRFSNDFSDGNFTSNTNWIGEITIEPKSFSPNNDSYKDICYISWNFNEPNLTATIKAFYDEGGLVKKILNNKMIWNTGIANWGGASEDGLQLKTGMYIIWVEVFSENDNIECFKRVDVLSR